ncbi:MAG: hypothetical protein ACTSP4_10150 [Candidatus Hodarchaeales archaeon]
MKTYAKGWSFIELGLKLNIAGNIGQILLFICLFIYFLSSVIPTLLFLLLMVVILTIDIFGHVFLGIGLCKHRPNRKRAIRAGTSFIIWSAFAIVWRTMLVLGYLLTPYFSDQTRSLIFDVCTWLFIWNCMIMIFGIVNAVWALDTGLAILVFAIINFIGSFMLGTYFFDSLSILLADPLIIENFNNLFLGNVKVFTQSWPDEVFLVYRSIFYSATIKFIITPILGILAYRELLKQAKPFESLQEKEIHAIKKTKVTRAAYWNQSESIRYNSSGLFGMRRRFRKTCLNP